MSLSPSRLLPPALPSGGRIGVVSLSSPVPSERLDAGVQAIRALGYEVALADGVLACDGHHAGSPEARAAALHGMFARDDVDAIFCARGGSSSIRVLQHLDAELIRRHPKVFVGYSDITSVMLALWARAGLGSFFGPMVTPDFAGGVSDTAWQCLHALVAGPPAAALPSDLLMGREMTTLVGGRCRGVLVGGTLALVVATLGTRDQIDLRDRIFFFEDIHETPARIERYLTQLLYAGILQPARGFVVGPLRWDVTDEERAGYHTFERVLTELLGPLGRPVLVGCPFGHVKNPLTMPLGSLAELDSDARTLRILEPTVRPSRAT